MEKSTPSNRQECNEILFKKFSELANAKMETEPERNEKNLLLMLEIYKTLFIA